ncbi:DUF89 family protein [bacterium]|nr:DUF89 family protein [bacterium]
MVLAGYGCIGCVIDDVVGALLPLVDDDLVRQAVIKRCLAYLEQEFTLEQVPSVFITQVHRILKQVTGLTLPFERLRRRCNEIGLLLAKRVEQRCVDLGERERFAEMVRWAIAGNELDFRTVGTGYEIEVDQIETRLQSCVERPLAVNHLDQILDLIKRSTRMVYIPDNVGEIAFDLLLVKQFREWGMEVLFPLRGGPITSDATMEDGLFVGADRIASDVFEAGPDTLGILLHEASPRLHKELQRADLIICKGQANFYTFSEYKHEFPGAVVSLLRTKCDWAASYFGLEGKINIAAVLKG